MNPETVENPKDYDQGPAVPIPQVVPSALPNMDYSGDSDLSMPNMDTEHTPVETPIKTPVQVPNISQRPTPIKVTNVVSRVSLLTSYTADKINPFKLGALLQKHMITKNMMVISKFHLPSYSLLLFAS